MWAGWTWKVKPAWVRSSRRRGEAEARTSILRLWQGRGGLIRYCLLICGCNVNAGLGIFDRLQPDLVVCGFVVKSVKNPGNCM